MSYLAGIFGNSEDHHNATWRIQALDIANMVSGGVITEMSAMPHLDDFFAISRDNEWHQVIWRGVYCHYRLL